MCENYVGGGSPTVKTINTAVIFARTQLGDPAVSNQFSIPNRTMLLFTIMTEKRFSKNQYLALLLFVFSHIYFATAEDISAECLCYQRIGCSPAYTNSLGCILISGNVEPVYKYTEAEPIMMRKYSRT